MLTENLSGPAVYALGNFDGVHLGHRHVLDEAIASVREFGLPARVLTFEPHPRTLFQPDTPPFRLTPRAMKERLLKQSGIADIVTLNFTHEFARMSAADFVQQVLIDHLQARHIVAGYDFTFGHNREGNMSKLAEWLASYDVGVNEIAPFGDGATFSSTRIRNALRDGDLAEAREMLGRDWAIAGAVTQGDQRGRKIGIPTANIALGEVLRPKFGVYAVTARRVGSDETVKGVANIGTRPTVGGTSENLEAHLLDFDRDIYGEEWEFALTRFIRPETKFDGLDELKAQIARDIEIVKQG